MKYILVKGDVSGAKTINGYCSGLPAMTTINGFVGYLNSQIEMNNSLITSYMVGFSDFSLASKRGSISHFGNSKGDTKILAVDKQVLSNFKVEFIFEIDDSPSLIEDLKSALGCARFAGGTLCIDHNAIESYNSIHEASAHTNSPFYLEDKSEISEDYTFEEIINSVDYCDDPDEYTVMLPINEGILQLTQIGFKLLESPKEKEFSRNNLPHAYCEPVLGLIGLSRLRKRSRNQNELEYSEYCQKYAWSPLLKNESGLIVVSPKNNN